MPEAHRAALISGASRGLGRAIALKLATEGWRVGLLARDPQALDETAQAIGDEGGFARALPGDVLSMDDLTRNTTLFLDWTGHLDEFALVCCAGLFRGIGPVGIVDLGAWWRDVETALRGTYQTITAAQPILDEAGKSSISVLVGPGHNGELAHGSGYGVAQAGLARLVESLAKEFKPRSIPVFAVNPGLAPTPMIQHLLDSEEARRWLPRFTEAFAEGKEVGPEVAAEMIAWLSRARPAELSGRVVSAMATPEMLELRLKTIQSQGSGLLRLS